MPLAKKAQLIKALILSPELIAKGQYSDKMEELMDFFGLSSDDMEEDCELCWKVSDLVRSLQQAVKLESFVAKAAPTEKAAEPNTLKPTVWPNDMASAKFDPVAKAYAREDTVWGRDR